LNVPSDDQTDNTTPPDRRLLTMPQAAELLQVGRCKMQELVLSGQIRSLKIGRLRRIPAEAIDEYIAQALSQQTVAA
jgi:excisionase family DNA binding protein